MAELFNPASIEENAFLLASHNPQGRVWENGFNPDDPLGKLFLGLAVEFYRFQVIEKNLYDEMDIRKTNELLSAWERSVGIPDSCFTNINVDLATRRRQVEQKFSKFGGVQTAEDFIRVAAFFGFTVVKENIRDSTVLPATLPMQLNGSGREAAHTLVFTLQSGGLAEKQFPLPFPLTFSEGGENFLQCLFDELAPANVQVIIRISGTA